MAATPSYHYRLGEDRKDALAAMARDRGTDETAQVKAAIDAALAVWRAGRMLPGITVTTDPQMPPGAAVLVSPGQKPVVFAVDEICPPHPPARVIKGFCGACGHPV